jgi:hypothetical protein
MKLTRQELLTASTLGILAGLSVIGLAQGRIEVVAQQMRRSDLKDKLQQPAAEAAAPPLTTDETEDIGPQFVVRQKPRKSLLEASADVQYGQTSNVFLTETDRVKTTFAVSTLQIAFAPEPLKLDNGSLGWKLGYRHQKFNYGKLSNKESIVNDIDFDISTIFAQARYLYKDNWLFSAGFDYNRMLNAATGDYDEFYSELAPNVGVDTQIKLGEKSSVGFAFFASAHFSDVDAPVRAQNDRLDEAVTVSYNQQLTEKLFVQPFYRAQLIQYTRNQGREDVVHSVGLNVGYTLNKWSSIRVFANYESRDSSDNSINDYRKFDNGVGVSFNTRF